MESDQQWLVEYRVRRDVREVVRAENGAKKKEKRGKKLVPVLIYQSTVEPQSDKTWYLSNPFIHQILLRILGIFPGTFHQLTISQLGFFFFTGPRKIPNHETLSNTDIRLLLLHHSWFNFDFLDAGYAAQNYVTGILEISKACFVFNLSARYFFSEHFWERRHWAVSALCLHCNNWLYQYDNKNQTEF